MAEQEAGRGERIVDMPICEQRWIIPKVGVLYRFYVAEGCESCERLGEAYDTATPEGGHDG